MRTHSYRIAVLAALLTVLLPIFPAPASAADLPHHDLTINLDPGKKSLAATDRITFPEPVKEAVFLLHAGLKPSSQDKDVRIEKAGTEQGNVPLERWRVRLPAESRSFTLSYGGVIFHPMIAAQNQARGFDETPGTISSEGVYLASSSAWYPLLDSEFMTFTLAVTMPAGWDAVSQGKQTVHEKGAVTWDSPEPQQEIYLLAGKYRVSEKPGKIRSMVYLRTSDDALAQKYLDATERYIALYDALIGPYPYAKFALVENFWETGFGMPSFTLLGPTVLRLPFIINTSYPHEILHNWWGNSVYPVYGKGNWSEGITAYLADHLLKEQQGGGADYRLNTLQKYADYVQGNRDFPLTQFTSRHSASTEAVGYGKALMFFHMLRLELGDKAFIAAFRKFYQEYKFRLATFDDMEKSFSAATGRDLKAGFREWVTRTGAPEIRLEKATVGDEGRVTKKQQFVLRLRLKQVQEGEPYRLRIPVAVTVEGQDKAVQTVVEMQERAQLFEVATHGRPLRVDIDPEFDLFRRLDRDEIPPAITQALGAAKMLVVLPSSAAKELLAGYREFAKALGNAGPDEVEVKLDRDVKTLPKDRTVAILGWENNLLGQALPAWKGYSLSLEGPRVAINRTETAKEDHSFVLTGRNPGNGQAAVLFVAADRPGQLPGLARKLPHYHKYSFLAFEGNEPQNVVKGRWPVVDSPLTALLPSADGKISAVDRANLAPREALAPMPEIFSGERMMETVRSLASEKFRGRMIGTPELDEAADTILRSFKQAGIAPGGDRGTYLQQWEMPDPGGSGKTIPMKNVIAVFPGRKKELAGQSVVVGAHYDHLGTGSTLGRPADRGKIHPGADDNASGVAVLLELARVLRNGPQPDRSIVFAAFTGEEEGKLGSAHYVKSEKEYPASKSTGMLNLDTVGRLGRNKLLILGGSSAREWVHIFRGAGFVTGVDIEMVSEDLDASDQKSFQQAGVPAVQLFSGPNLDYHRPTDTPDKIDAAGMVKVASVAREVIEYLASRDQPLTAAKPDRSAAPGPQNQRKVSLGTIPDFSYKGKGVRLSGVVEGSPAAAAGMKEGDVITRLGGSVVGGLKDLSDLLKALQPGARTNVTFLRGSSEQTVAVDVQAR